MRKGQIFTIDLITALVVITLISLLLLSAGIPKNEGLRTQEDARALAGVIYTPLPIDWNMSTVIRPGFVVNHRVNETLLSNFSNLNPNTVRQLTGLRSEYQVLIYEAGVLDVTIGVAPAADAKSVHSIRRFAVRNGNITQIEVIAWQ